MRDHRRASRQDPDPAAPVENPFRGMAVATRYAAARPDLHRLVIELLAHRVPSHAVLDLGAGTGLSTRALRGFAEIVVGVDSSADMLRARSESLGSYVLAAAELLPFRDEAFDLATVASALHWFGGQALGEVARVLTPPRRSSSMTSGFAPRWQTSQRFTTGRRGLVTLRVRAEASA